MDNLIDIFHKELSKEASSSSHKAIPKFRPSSLGSPCLRKIYYGYLRVEEDFKAPLQLKKYAKAGTVYHEILSEMFRNAGVLIDYRDENGNTPQSKYELGKLDHEFPLKDEELEISAKIDGVLILDGKLWLGEWKTATTKSFMALRKPKPEHLIQGSTYLYLFNKALKDGHYRHIPQLSNFEKAEGIIFLYANKDDLSLKEYPITEASGVFTQTITKILEIKSHHLNSTLPPKTPDWCSNCAYRTKCANNFKV